MRVYLKGSACVVAPALYSDHTMSDVAGPSGVRVSRAPLTYLTTLMWEPNCEMSGGEKGVSCASEGWSVLCVRGKRGNLEGMLRQGCRQQGLIEHSRSDGNSEVAL